MQNRDLEKIAVAVAAPLIELALAEDLGAAGDLTTQAILPAANNQTSTAMVIAKSAGVLAGLKIFARVFAKVDARIQLAEAGHDGEQLRPQQIVARLHGSPASLLTGERVALNFLQRLSGIASLTKKFVEAVAGTKAKILDTRKTTPGWRILEKYAVQCGGGVNHRLGLHDMFLIKENHLAAAGGIAPAVRQCREFSPQTALEVEARTLADVEECLRHGVKHIMLDNMPLVEMQNAVQLVAGRAQLEASGNVSLENVGAVAATGVDYISVGALTHSAPAMDFSLLIM